MKTLLQLQALDLKIEACRLRETEIPKQKGKFEVQRKRLAAELQERETAVRDLQLAQRTAEGDIEKHQAQISKYNTQLLAVKKNEEYTALLHEIEGVKKQIGQLEEKILAIMMDIDQAKTRLAEDRKRIEGEVKKIETQCAEIDAELGEAVKQRQALETQREPIAAQVEPNLMARYRRIRDSKKTGAAVVPLRGEHCSGCNMAVPAQVVNEVLGGAAHSCRSCGRLLYAKELYETGNFTTQTA